MRRPSLQRLIFILFVFLKTAIGYSQAITIDEIAPAQRKKYEKANQQAKNKDYAKALKAYDRILSGAPHFIDAIIAKGNVLQKLEQNDAAASMFKQAIQLDPNYLPRLHYILGLYALDDKDYPQAINYFQTYISLDPASNRASSARKYSTVAEFRQEIVSNPVPFKPIKLPEPINSTSSEYLPSFTADQIMVFSRRIGAQEDLFYSIYEKGNWKEPVPIESINTPENEAAHSISADGQWLVFTMCNNDRSMGSCDLFISQRLGNVWSKPQNIGHPINTQGWEAQPTLSADGSILIFASSRQGGYGDYDLWVSHRNGMQWSSPENLGPTVNTAGKDETPFLHADGETLYFSSNGHLGMGNADLFVTRKTEQGWTEPLNLGYPINTENKEGAMSVTLNGLDAYYASDRNHSEIPNLDIYKFRLPEHARANPVTYVQTFLVDAKTGQPIPGLITIVNLKDYSRDTIVLKAGNAPIHLLPLGTRYAFLASSENYSMYSDHFDLDTATSLRNPYVLNIKLKKIKESDTDDSKPIVLRNIFFQTGSSTLLPASIPELDYLKNYLIAHRHMEIEIRGHTDNTGTPAINIQLSIDRANAVRQYLIEQGISPGRLTAEGFGATEPIDSNDSPEGRQKNRRTEFVIKP